MKQFLKRLLGTIPVIIGVVLLIFLMLRIIPGDAVSVLLGDHVSQDTIDRLTAAMGLDKPMWQQFVSYIGNLFKGDLGISYTFGLAAS